MMRQPLLRVIGLSRYYGTTPAIRGLQFELRSGEVLGLLGQNGAGKSTTLQMLAGVLAPTSGRIVTDGWDLASDPIAAKRLIGYLPEHPPLYQDLTTDEYLQFCGRLRGLRGHILHIALERAVEQCGLGPLRRRLLGNLSKGFRQRVGIAQAVLHEPALIVLDEPTSGLDPLQTHELRVLVRELGRNHGVIVSTHRLSDVHATCTRVQILHAGRLVFDQGMAELRTDHESRQVTRVLLRHPPEDSRLLAIQGVTAVERPADDHLRLHHTEHAIGEQVAAAAVTNGWGLLEIAPERHSLEQRLLQLTMGEPPLDTSPSSDLPE